MTKEDLEKEQSAVETKKQLSPYAAVGDCHYGENPAYLHGDACDMCELPVLHPVDAAQRSQPIKSCIEANEKDMEFCSRCRAARTWCVASAWRQSTRKPTPASATSGFSPTATTPTVSSVFASGGVLSNLRARS